MSRLLIVLSILYVVSLNGMEVDEDSSLISAQKQLKAEDYTEVNLSIQNEDSTKEKNGECLPMPLQYCIAVGVPLTGLSLTAIAFYMFHQNMNH